MVSIFADEVYNERSTISVTDQDNVEVAFDGLTFTSANVSTVVGGFTYVETVIATVDFVQDIDLDHTQNSGFSGVAFQVVPVYEFNSALNLFNTLAPSEFDSQGFNAGQNRTVEVSGTTSITADTYVDTPATMSVTLDMERTGSGEAVVIDGNQTIDVDVIFEFIGRQP